MPTQRAWSGPLAISFISLVVAAGLEALDIGSGGLLPWLAGLTIVLGAYDFGKTLGVEEGRAEARRACFRATGWCDFCGFREEGATSCAFRGCDHGLPFDVDATNAHLRSALYGPAQPTDGRQEDA